MSKKKLRYFIKDKDGCYLVKGKINDKPFDGNGKPYQFTRNEALCVTMSFDNYEMEEVNES